MSKMLQFWDFVVLAVVLLVSALIGIYYGLTGDKQRTNKEYLHANKNMSIVPVAFSLVASFMSAITLLGVSSEIYTFGLHFIVINLAYALCTPIAAYLYLPVFFKLQVTSAYEYLELRFGKASRLCASLLYSFQMILYMGIVLYAPALALEALTGIQQTVAILSVGLVCTFYSTIGGMKAVLMTDLFQAMLMFAAVLSVIVYSAMQKGGLSQVWKIAEDGGRIDLLNFNVNPTERHTWWTLIIGGSVTYLSLYAVNQTQIQRYLTVRDLKTAQKALFLNWPILTLLSLITSFTGLCIYAKYVKCDPLKEGKITSPAQLMPLFVMETMSDYHGLAGLFTAGIFSASLSTVSAAMNSLAAVTISDYLKPSLNYLRGRPLPDKEAVMLAKVLSTVYGVLFVALAFLAPHLGGILQASLTIFGIVGGPLLGIFTLGMFTTRSNEKGVLLGMMFALIMAAWMAFGGPRPPPLKLPTAQCNSNATFNVIADAGSQHFFWLYRVSYLYNGVFGLLITLLLGYLSSMIIWCVSNEPIKENSALYVSFISRRMEEQQRKIENHPLEDFTVTKL